LSARTRTPVGSVPHSALGRAISDGRKTSAARAGSAARVQMMRLQLWRRVVLLRALRAVRPKLEF
jgi:hypothetical protein